MQAQDSAKIDRYSRAFEQYSYLVEWLESGQCPISHSDVERGIRDRGMELMRLLYEAHLDGRTQREREKAMRIVHEPGAEVRTRWRGIESDFGRVGFGRLGYKRAGRPAEFPLDRELNLPDELYSLEVRQRSAIEAARGCWDEVVSTIDRSSGAHVPKRQAQQLAVRAAEDFDAFYEQRVHPANDVIGPKALEVASCDGKGVTMLEKGLREDTRKAAQKAKQDAVRGDPMAPKKLRRHDKRMAIVTANWEQERQPRTAEQILANLDRRAGDKKPKGPRPEHKRVRASIEKSQADGIAEMFDEIERRDPGAQRTTVVLVDGEEKQLEQIKRQAELRKRPVAIAIDLIHVIHYLWIARYLPCSRNATTTQSWLRSQPM